MDPFTVAMTLIALGAVFLIIEALSPGAFMLIPGAVLVIVGLIGIAFPDDLLSWKSPIIAIAVAIPVTLITIKVYLKLGSPIPPSTTVVDSLVGRDGVVTVATDSTSMRGKVAIGNDIWSATSDEPIEIGANVTVEKSEGVHVHVRRV